VAAVWLFHMFQIELGCCSPSEEAIQLDSSDPDNKTKMLSQCRIWRDQLWEHLQKNRQHRDASMQLKIKWFPHDFGSYCEVVACCDEKDEFAIEAALWLEANMPVKIASCDR